MDVELGIVVLIC